MRSTPNSVLDGYTASNSVTVKVRDIDKAGAVIDLAVDAGATMPTDLRCSGLIASSRRETRFVPR